MMKTTAVSKWKFYYRQMPYTRKKKTYRRVMWQVRREAYLERANAALQRRASAAEAEVARLRAENVRLMEHCKFIDREVEGGITPTAVDALYDITAREYGENDSEVTS